MRDVTHKYPKSKALCHCYFWKQKQQERSCGESARHNLRGSKCARRAAAAERPPMEITSTSRLSINVNRSTDSHRHSITNSNTNLLYRRHTVDVTKVTEAHWWASDAPLNLQDRNTGSK
ncbi:hypothetical protein EVAR_65099_1 [Eumeta japonica]|uniref:Uncharacterized protein n=1 Tax=Eumeta variegata TaxID=151549 RepID=A0A4C1ZX48_EUMVA|nr:hypothetical protein EVAR_65099_1 [Eumeta japonica]